jgi:hypothetical protein
LVVLGFELRASSLLYHTNLFALVLLEIKSHIYAWADLYHNPICVSPIAGIPGPYYYAQLFNWLRWGVVSLTFLSCPGSSQTVILLISAS